MYIEGIAIILVALLNLFLGYLVLMRNPKVLINLLFSLIAFAFFGWSLSLFFYKFPVIFDSLFWIKVTYTWVSIFSAFILCFSFAFPRRTLPHKLCWIAMIWNVAYFFFGIYLLFFTSLFVQKVVVDPQKGIQTILGTGFTWWFFATWVPFLWASINFIIKSKTAKSIEKVQMNFLWVSFIVFSLFVCVPDAFIPWILHDTSYFSISPLTNLVFSGTVAYIILRHRFLDTRRVFAQAVSNAIVLFALGIIYAVIAYGIGYFFFPSLLNIKYISVTVLATLIVRVLVNSQHVKITKAIQKLFYRDAYDREDVLITVSEIIVDSIELNQLTKNLAVFLNKTFKVIESAIVIKSQEKNSLFIIYSSGPKREVEHTPQFAEELMQATEHLMITDELPEGEVKTFFLTRKVSFCIPLIVRGQQVGYFALYERLPDNMYSNYDIKTIEMIAPHIALGVQNALYVERIQNFNSSLKKEVEKSTKDLRLANAHLKDLDRLKDEFISMASHELRTPTTVIKSFLWIMLHKDKQVSLEAKKRLKRIYELANHMGSLIKDMLDVSLLESGKMQMAPESFDIVVLVHETMEELATAHATNRVVTLTGLKKQLVFADRDKIHQVLNNLLSNAIKYTKENGHIHIAVAKNKEAIEISVSDNGMGIKKEYMEKLFTKFGKLHSVRSPEGQIPGSGLGLYISKRIMDLSSGKFLVTSEYGKGTTFAFTLPSTPK